MPGRSAYTSFGRFLVFSWRVLGRTSVLVLGGVRLFFARLQADSQKHVESAFSLFVCPCAKQAGETYVRTENRCNGP